MRAVHAKSLQLCPTFCDAMDCSPPGSSVYGILQARILEWVSMLSSRGSAPPGDQIHVSHISCTGKPVLYSSLAPPGKSFKDAIKAKFGPKAAELQPLP